MIKYAIITIACLPLRFEPSERSEMETQLLFGEVVEIIETKGNWTKVKNFSDKYEGWVDNNNFIYLDENELTYYLQNKVVVTNILTLAKNSKNETFLLPGGSLLPYYDPLNQTFMIKNNIFYLEQPVTSYQPTSENIILLAKQYHHAPYLWGGKTALGIDCSGLSQVVFKMCGIQLPRNADQQSEKGTLVQFIENAQPGDLLFFDNEEGKIIHVGIYMGNNKIIHASGKVRIDSVDSHGIYNIDKAKYTHHLRLIKRIL